jgi:hypothetical protein
MEQKELLFPEPSLPPDLPAQNDDPQAFLSGHTDRQKFKSVTLAQ